MLSIVQWNKNKPQYLAILCLICRWFTITHLQPCCCVEYRHGWLPTDEWQQCWYSVQRHSCSCDLAYLKRTEKASRIIAVKYSLPEVFLSSLCVGFFFSFATCKLIRFRHFNKCSNCCCEVSITQNKHKHALSYSGTSCRGCDCITKEVRWYRMVQRGVLW